MSTKRKKTPGSRTPGSSPNADPRTEASSQSSEMNGNERIFGISELTLRQQSVLPILAVSRSIAQAARDARVAESTLRRWLKDRKFREELDSLRKESYDLVLSQVQAVLPACISVVAETALESSEPALRFRAACFLINYATKVSEVDLLHDELKDLDEAVSQSKKASPLSFR